MAVRSCSGLLFDESQVVPSLHRTTVSSSLLPGIQRAQATLHADCHHDALGGREHLMCVVLLADLKKDVPATFFSACALPKRCSYNLAPTRHRQWKHALKNVTHTHLRVVTELPVALRSRCAAGIHRSCKRSHICAPLLTRQAQPIQPLRPGH